MRHNKAVLRFYLGNYKEFSVKQGIFLHLDVPQGEEKWEKLRARWEEY